MTRQHRPKRRDPSEPRPCRMPKCGQLTRRPLGYCEDCWNEALRAEGR